MAEYTHTIRRHGDVVRYEIFRDGDSVASEIVRWCDLNSFTAVFLAHNNTAKAIEAQFKIAKKEVELAIKTLIASEV